MTIRTFNCDRTCKFFQECRFRPVLRQLGTNAVYSHTVSVSVEFRSPEAFAAAAIALGGEDLGHGCHKLFEDSHTGRAVQLPGWTFPIVLAGGELKFDNYNGKWGDQKDIDRLTAEYTLAASVEAAEQLGWMTQRDGDAVTIFHPDGGTITCNENGEMETSGFVGTGCVSAREMISAALGEAGPAVMTPEANQLLQSQHVTEGGA